VLDVGKIGLESLQIKSPDVVYVSSKSQDRLIVTIVLENGNTYDYPARDYSEDDVRMHRHDGMKGLMNQRQTRFDVVIRNDPDVGGQNEIADVSVNVSHSARKI
jgi:cell division septal protein FtsQ